MTSDCKDLVGKVAIVTGTGFAGNIGEAIALALAEAGASVVCADLPGTPNGEIVAQRLAQGLDVAEMVHFLASNRSTWITGQIIQVDGGFLSHFPVTAGITAILEGED